MQYDFPKMRGGVEGCLEFFRKFIRFGSVTRRLHCWHCVHCSVDKVYCRHMDISDEVAQVAEAVEGAERAEQAEGAKGVSFMGFWSKSGVGNGWWSGVDTPYTVMTTRAPAVLKNTQAQMHPTIRDHFLAAYLKLLCISCNCFYLWLRPKVTEAYFTG